MHPLFLQPKMRHSYLRNSILAFGISALDQHVQAQGQNTSALVSQAISALGGIESISAINNVQYIGESILRTKGLMLSISVDGVDQATITAGRQNVTHSYDQSHVKQRIDKVAQLGSVFTFGRTELEPMVFAHIVEGGDDSFAARVEGSSLVFAPSLPPGYLDGLLASYLITEAYKWDPLLLRTILNNGTATYREGEVEAGLELPGIHDETTGLTVLFDPETNLPHIIRSYEDHPFFGPSTHDLLIYNYTEIDGVMFPKRFKTIYNNKHVIADYAADQVLTNQELDEGLFNRPGNGTVPEASVPTRNPEYSFAEIGGFSNDFV